MRAIDPSSSQAEAIVRAMHAVASAQGSIPLLPVEHDSIVAIQRHLLQLETPIEPVAGSLPDDLAAIITEPTMRRQTIRILTLLPVIDQKVLAEKARVVEAAAAQLAIEDGGLVILRQAVRRQWKRIAFGMMTRSVAHYWSPTGKARLRDWLDMLRIFAPKIPGLYEMMTDRRLLAKYRALASHPAETLGNALYRFYSQRDFPLPGEPNSFPEGWSKHEVYHVVSEYDSTLQGEMLNAAFSGGNTEILCMDLLMLTLLQFQAGLRVMPGPVLQGELRPDAFFRAVARGIAMNVDLLAGWDMWSVVDLPIDEVRRRLNVPGLSVAERTTLAGWNALIV